MLFMLFYTAEWTGNNLQCLNELLNVGRIRGKERKSMEGVADGGEVQFSAVTFEGKEGLAYEPASTN